MTKLAPVDVGPRVERLRSSMTGAGLDGLLVTSPMNIRWLTGFTGSHATVTVTADEVQLFTDSRYRDRAPAELDAAGSRATVVVSRNVGDGVRDALAGVGTIGAEADHLTWAQADTIRNDWFNAGWFSAGSSKSERRDADEVSGDGGEIVATQSLIAGLRASKDAAEIARIEAAAAIVDVALGSCAPLLATGPTERAFARQLEAAIRAEADDVAFDTIVASGPNAAIAHHRTGDRRIHHGEFVIVDVGALVDGYRSDMTRTFLVGTPNAEQRRHYDVVAHAQQAGVEAMAPGVATSDVDAAARAVIADAGWAEFFEHGTGHGVGLDIHELPRVASSVDDIYTEGTVATVEPGVYLPGQGGVRVEDTCVATEGGARRLTGFPKVLDPTAG